MTENEIFIDALGKRCPRPIIELAKARRSAPPNGIIRIVADDLAFESDVVAWCETTENHLTSFSKEGEVMTALIQLS